SGGSMRGGGTDLVDAAVIGGKKANLENEVELLKSIALMSKVVAEHNFNLQFYTQGNVKLTEVYYKNVPFTFEFDSISDSSGYYSYDIIKLNATGGIIAVGSGQKKSNFKFSWNVPSTIGKNTIKLSNPTASFSSKEIYKAVWRPVVSAAGEILGGLGVAPFSPKTSIISFKLVCDEPQRGADILNALIEEYKNSNVEEKNKAAKLTIQFINERLEVITKELGDVEVNLVALQKANPDIAIRELFGINANNYGNNMARVKDLLQRKTYADWLEKKMKNSETIDVVPSSLGLDDPIIAKLVADYTSAKVLLPTTIEQYAKNSDKISEAQTTSKTMRSSILLRLKDYIDEVNKTIYALNSANKDLNNGLTKTIDFTRNSKGITRYQAVKEAIFVYLIQRREETLISSASTSSSYVQIDTATVPGSPFEPNQGRWRMYGIIIGLLIPIGLIYIKNLLNDKVTSREDITKKTEAPFIGEVGHYTNTKAFVVSHKSRSIISEQFRIIRSNLQFLSGNQKTILVTSSISGEGKSFVTLNLGAVIAISGKKVAVLEFDLRKPRIIKNIGVEKKEMGISNFLIGQTDKLDDLYYTFEEYPTLHIFGCGPIPPNPSELMLGENMGKLFEKLKAEYEYVIIDSAPVGLV
ncbi:MAG: hypothetical protein NTZ59_11835, partial [Bacteroidetes bacterium]|nr:hypothetical protein [Bacteroidota bacterium]